MASRLLEAFYRKQEPGTEVVGVEVPFEMPLIDQETGEVLDRPLVGSLDLIERSAEGQLVVVEPGSTPTSRSRPRSSSRSTATPRP